MRWNFRRCKRCTAHFVPTEERPDHCTACAVVLASSIPVVADSIEPLKPYELTGTDEGFLKSLRIRPE